MSLMQLYFSIPFLPLAAQLATYPYRAWKAYNAPKVPDWDKKNPMVNLSRICQTKREILGRSLAPKQIYGLIPSLTQKTLGAATHFEANDRVNALSEAGALGAGAIAAAIPIVKFFGKCLANSGPGTCAAHTASDLFSYSSFPLLAGAYLVSRVSKIFFFNLFAVTFGLDNWYDLRRVSLTAEYQKIQGALIQVLDLSADDPKFKETVPLARQFLRIAPEIERELHETFSLDPGHAKQTLAALTNICRQIVLKETFAVKEALPKTVESPISVPAQPLK